MSAAPSPVPLPGGLARSRLTWLMPVPDRSPIVIVSAPPRALTSTASIPVQVHHDVGPRRAMNRARDTVAERFHFLIDVRAVEKHRVEAGLSFDGVASVAGIPDEGVVPCPHQGCVIAAAAHR